MTKNKSNTRHNTTKSEYNRMWYEANKSYKKTYSRFNYRANQAVSRTLQNLTEYARDALVIDRAAQVREGRWIDERDGSIYSGIRA